MYTIRLSGMILVLLFAATALTAQDYDDFTDATLDPVWSWVRERPANWTLRGGTYLVIRTEPGALNTTDYNNVRNILLQDVPDEDVIRMETRLLFTPEHWYHNAGLIYRIDDDNYIRVSRGIYPDINGVWMEWEVDGKTAFHFVNDVSSDSTWLRLSRTDDTTFYATYSLNGYEWYEIGKEHIRFPVGQAQAGLQAANGEGIMAGGRPLDAWFDYFGMMPTGVGGTVALPAATDIVSLYPNPLANGETAVVAFRIDRGSEVQWYVSDMLGRRIIAPISSGRLQPGIHTVSFSLRDVPPGAYFMHIIAGSTRATQRILLTR